MNLCRSCNQDFVSMTLFDQHRVGKHDYLWSPDQEDGRRCLDEEEMLSGSTKKGSLREPWIKEDGLWIEVRNKGSREKQRQYLYQARRMRSVSRANGSSEREGKG